MRLDRRHFLALVAAGLSGLRVRVSWAVERVPLAARLHRETRNTLTGTLGRRLWPPSAPPPRAKRYPGRRRVPLPPPGGRGGASLDEVVRTFAPADRFDASPLSLDTVSRLLLLANGVTQPGRPPLRAAPSAGALYAGEVYLVSLRVDGLAPGIYSYHVPSHSLVVLGEVPGVAGFASAVDRPEALTTAPAWVLLSNVFRRYGNRYANRGYRYALIDTGHIGENLRLAAAAEGLGTASPLRFRDERLNGLLGIDGREEAVCAVHAVGRQAGQALGTPGESFVEAQYDDGFRAEGGWSTPEVFHAGTSLVPGQPDRLPLTLPPGGRGSAGEALPSREPPKKSLAWTITERRSTRRFQAVPVALPDLAYLLAVAQGNSQAALTPGIELRVVAHRIRGLPPGLYRYVPEAHELVLLREGDLRGALRRACLGQEMASSAAAGVAMVADLSRVVRGGDRLYRDQLIESGAIGQRLYLGAEALGLSARNLAAFLDDSFNRLLSPDGQRGAVIHLTMLGAGD